ncbi:vomeronasal type-1 receptor 4-like, partial [Sigmodon hispidus]
YFFLEQRSGFVHYLNNIKPGKRMDLWNLIIKIIFLSQTTTGILANFSFLCYYLVNSEEHIVKPTYVIHMHLMSANALIVLSKGVPYTMAVFGLKQFLNDFECRLILYIERVGRSVSIGTTCLLSVFQVITISHKKFSCKDQNVKPAKYILYSIALLWFFYILINSIFLLYPFIKRSSKNVTSKHDFGYCSIVRYNKVTDYLYTAFVVCPEIFFSLLMVYSSGSMIIILYRHKQRVQHIHSTHGSCRPSHESRATLNILVLVSTFLCFYTLSSILQCCISLLYNHNWLLVNITFLTSLCFPCFGPFLVMNQYSVVMLCLLAKNK